MSLLFLFPFNSLPLKKIFERFLMVQQSYLQRRRKDEKDKNTPTCFINGLVRLLY